MSIVVCRMYGYKMYCREPLLLIYSVTVEMLVVMDSYSSGGEFDTKVSQVA